MKNMPSIHFGGLFLTHLRWGYVSPMVLQNKYFWLLLLVVVAACLLYQNRLSSRTNAGTKDRIAPDHDPGAPIIGYSSDGRSGHVHYQGKESDFALYYEFGGGDCIASINIPSPGDWVATTGIPLEKREETLHHIGQQVVKDQTVGGTGRYEIQHNWIIIKK